MNADGFTQLIKELTHIDGCVWIYTTNQRTYSH